ncbi:hypothetical protein SDC9_178031 [bioreactor metagenome]|uniref:Uncharacterized protein n=1 Tax=bioreactor metagenome TaxID=1076179 RepID=A0A645GW28_9ZZZZ
MDLMHIKSAGHTRKKCGYHESDNFILDDVYAHRLGGNVVFTNGKHGAPRSGVNQIMCEHDSRHQCR